jgi:hypothetical protein
VLLSPGLVKLKEWAYVAFGITRAIPISMPAMVSWHLSRIWCLVHPKEIVNYMVERVDHLLWTELNQPHGLGSPAVRILAPCCGTVPEVHPPREWQKYDWSRAEGLQVISLTARSAIPGRTTNAVMVLHTSANAGAAHTID